MKKILAFLGLLFVAVFGLVGCNGSTNEDLDNDNPPVIDDQEDEKEEEYFKLILPESVMANVSETDKIKKGSEVTLFVEVSEGKEIDTLLINSVDKKDKLSNSKITITINEDTTVEVTFKEIGEGDTTDPESFLTIAEFKALEDKKPGVTKGTVIAKGTSGKEGFYVEDSTGVLFVYRINEDTFKVGDLVKLEGTKDSYYNVVQMADDAKITVLEQGKPIGEYEQTTIYDILELDPLSSLGMKVEFTGVVKEKQDRYTDYYLSALDDSSKDVKVYFKSNEADIKKYVDEAVTVKAIIHDWHNEAKYFTIFVPVGEGHVSKYIPPATDEEKILATKNELKELISETVYFDLTLPKKGSLYEDVLISYQSSDPSVLSEEGIVNRQPEDTDVVLTINYTCQDKKEEEVKNLTVKAENTTGYHTFEEFYAMPDGHEAKIKGQVYQSGRNDLEGYFVTDGNLNILVYGSNEDVKVGQEVVINGKKQFYGKYTEQLVYNTKADISVLSENNESIATYEEISYSDLLKLEPSSENLNKNYLVELIPDKRLISYVTEAFAIDPYTLEEGAFTYRSNKDQILAYDQKLVKIEVVTYMFDQDGKVELYYGHHEGGIEEIAFDSPSITADKKLQSATSYLKGLYEGLEVKVSSIDLVDKTKFFELPVTWSSSDDSIINPTTGEVDQSEDREVVLTATVQIGEDTYPIDLTVNVLKLEVDSIVSVLEDLRSDIKKEVTIKGIVVATRGGSGVFVQDETGIIYVKGNQEGFVEGDEILVTGPSYTNKNSEFQIDNPRNDPNKKALISSGNEYELTPIKVTKENMDELIPTLHQKYVEIEAIPYETGSGYSKTIELYVGGDIETGRKVLIHNASNKNGLLLIGETKILLRGFAFRVLDSDTPMTFTLFLTNIEGEKQFLEKEDKFEQGFAYVLNVLPDENSLLTANLALPTYHTLDHLVKYQYTSSDEQLLSNEGVLGGKLEADEVTLTIAINVDGEVREKTIKYNIPAKKEGPRDLVFSFVSRGIGHNKIFAIYNGTGEDVNLDGYKIVALQNAGNGGYGMLQKTTDVSSKVELSGILEAGKTLVVYNSKMEQIIKDQIPTDVMTIEASNTVCEFNCKDTDLIYLVHGTQIIDRIGTFVGIPSSGSSAIWESEIIDQQMVIRKRDSLTNSNINWNDLESVRASWEIYPVKDANEGYEMPSILWDFESGEYPE